MGDAENLDYNLNRERVCGRRAGEAASKPSTARATMSGWSGAGLESHLIHYPVARCLLPIVIADERSSIP